MRRMNSNVRKVRTVNEVGIRLLAGLWLLEFENVALRIAHIDDQKWSFCRSEISDLTEW